MRFRFSWRFFATEAWSRGVTALLALSFCSVALAENLDWSGDVTVFGTTADERAPLLVMSPSGARLRAFCVRNDSGLVMKVSSDNGASWSAAVDTTFSSSRLHIRGAADAGYHYVVVCPGTSSTRRLFRFDPAANSFRTAWTTMIAPDRSAAVLCLDVMTDVIYEPADAYLNVGWIEQNAPRTRTLCFAQSRDRAANFDSVREMLSFEADESSTASLSVCAAWPDDEEHLWIAAALDRPGSIPEEIRLFLSSDQGVTWTARGAVDAAATSQTQPSLAAHAGIILLAYSCAVPPSARDVRLVYSLDGGESFALPQIVAGSDADEHSPHVMVDNQGVFFSLFYLRNSAGNDLATLMLRTGSLVTPWEMEAPTALCDANSVPASEEFSAAICTRGAAALWSSRFVTGDCDVRFDAAWRGSSVPEGPALTPLQAALCSVYPNPFNSSATMVVFVDHPAPLTLVITDPLGRFVRRMECGVHTAGKHHLPLSLAALSSGAYFIRIENSPAPPRKVLLIR